MSKNTLTNYLYLISEILLKKISNNIENLSSRKDFIKGHFFCQPIENEDMVNCRFCHFHFHNTTSGCMKNKFNNASLIYFFREKHSLKARL